MKKNITVRISFLMMMLGILFLENTYGQVNPSIEYSAPTLYGDMMAVNDTASVIDNEVLSPSGIPYNNYSMSSGVMLKMNYDDACKEAFTVTLGLEIQYNDTLFPSPQTKNISLTLSYDPAAAKTTSDRVVYHLPASRRVRAKIVSITSSLGGTTVPEYVSLETFISKQRHYSINPASTPTFYDIDDVSNADQLKISWNAVNGAEEYDLEWLYVDDYKDYVSSTHSYFTASELGYDFRHNATRVTTQNNEFIMKNLYEHGYLLFRVRAVSRFGTDYKQHWEGAWSSSSESGTVSTYGTNNKNRYLITSGHEDELNWQWTTTFAEEAKFKAVISYFDGGLRSRQTVTHNNTDSFTIVGESMYDHVGRKAIDALPVPTGERIIKYYDAFNNSIVSHDPYNWEDFELNNGVDICINSVAGMDTLSGASRYYSNYNADKNSFQAFVPHAYNYPFVQTEYTPDMTGKVRRQSGVGKDHKLGTDHETKYFYGTPGSQQELDALFGVEAGYYEHYKKEMTVDANGSVSVSYMNPAGKVIATALAGKNPANLKVLPTDTAKQLLTQELSSKNVASADSNMWTVSHEFLIPQSSNVKIEYKLADLRADIACAPSVCFDCLYDLHIALVDQCGNKLYELDTLGIKIFDDSCNVQDSFRIAPFQSVLPIGSYQLVKTLKINEEAMYKYESAFIANNVCARSVEEIYDSLVNLIDTSDCNPTCESCAASLGTESEYKETRLLETPYGYPRNRDSLTIVFNELYTSLCDEYGGTLTCPAYIGFQNNFKDSMLLLDSLERDAIIDSLNEKFSREWHYYYDDCMQLCDTVDECEGQYNLLLQDVSPGGQYLKYDLIYDGGADKYLPTAISYRFSLLQGEPDLPDYPLADTTKRNYKNPNIDYYNEDGSLSYILDGGVLKKPNEVTSDVFLANWKQSWAASLVKLHPEYCYYQFCIEKMQTANQFDRLMRYAESYEDAHAKKLFNPLLVNLGSAGYYVSPDSNRIDPVYEFDSIAYFEKAEMISKCSTYVTGYNMWELAVISAFCPGAQTTAEMDACLAAHAFGTGTTEQKDQQWETFRALYLSVRGQHLENARVNFANSNSCANCYIGHQGANADTCTTDFDSDSLINQQRIYITIGNQLGIDLEASAEDILEASTVKMKAAMNTNCAEQCNSYADLWMSRLSGCNLDAEDSALVRNRLIAVCSEGCDLYNPMGSSSVPPGSTSTYQNFGDVLASVGITPSQVCNADLLGLPLAYGHDYQASGFVKMDDCFEEKMDGLDITCSPTRESLLLDSLFAAIKVSKGTLVSASQFLLEYSTISHDLQSSVENVLAPYFFVHAGQQNKYSTSFDGSGNLIIRFQGSYDIGSPEECTIKIYKPTGFGYTNGFFDSIDYIGLFEANALSCDGNANASVFVETPYFSDRVNADVGCFPLCNKQATDSLVRLAFISQYCVDMSTENIAQIRKHRCGDTTAIPYIPRDLSCKPSCITCDKLAEAEAAFQSAYDEIYTIYLNDKGHIALDSGGNLEAADNFIGVFTTYMNDYFSFNLTYEDYNRLKENCEQYYRASVSIGDGGFAVYDQSNFLKIKNGCTWPIGLDSAYRDTLFNLLSVCNQSLAVVLPYEEISCDSVKRLRAYQEALVQHEYELQYTRAQFRREYLQKCRLAPIAETFRFTYTEQEYHYTLYYFDQAGNLMKTVPPAGVDYISNPTKLAQIVSDRNGTVSPGSGNTPAHTLVTRYKYNTLNQVYEQNTPDGGTSTYFYDKLGRVVVSQNAKQYAMTGNVYSHTLYDELGRIREVGQIKGATAMNDATAKSPSLLTTWINNALSADHITRTVYDDTAAGYGNFFGGRQENLRNRVSYMYTIREFLQYPDNSRPETEVYSLFSYDLHGNVKTVVQDIRALSMVSDNGAGRFRIDYDYDLISGNVHKVSYQSTKQDRFFHQYQYDGDNRLVNAYTSRDGIFWENDARYFYYKHGPLARVETGNLKVQGTDYAYTIHGWLKNVNSATLDSTRDIGKDAWGNVANINRYIPKDLFGFTLGYYKDDYQQIQPIADANKPEINYAAASAWDNASSSLYNGNIRHMVTAIGKFMEGNGRPMGYAYQYDHLNRLSNMYTWDSVDMANNTWVAGMKVKSDYHNRFTYDANGNILTQVRRGSLSQKLALDSLTYHYAIGTNRLTYVSDVVDVANYKDDIDNQVSGNYRYDPIGNLIHDEAEQIDTIKWNVYGKITDIIRMAGSSKPDLKFTYGPDGQRISKTAIWADSTKTEYYARDAQGNIMATYNETNPYFANSVDSSYNTVLAILIDSIGMDNFAQFIMDKYASDTVFYNRVNTYLPSVAAIHDMTTTSILGCYGDKLYNILFDCCEDCDDANARELMEQILDAGGFLNTLMDCNLEKLMLAVIKEKKTDFFSQLDGLFPPVPSSLSDQMASYLQTMGYEDQSGGGMNFLVNDVPPGFLVNYMLGDLQSLTGLDENTLRTRIKTALGNMNINDIKDVLRREWTPCDFLKCIGSCAGSGYGSNTPMTCTNAYTGYIEDAFDNKMIWNPEPSMTAIRSSLSGFTQTDLINCDVEAFVRALMSENIGNFLNSYESQYGDLNIISSYFINAYPPDNPIGPGGDAAYLASRVPLNALAWYLSKHLVMAHSADYTTLLDNYMMLGGPDLYDLVRDHYRDCDIKKCINVIDNSISYTPVSLEDYLKENLAEYTLSNAILCNPSMNTGKIQQSFLDNFANLSISQCGGPSLFNEGLKNIPYQRLTQWLDDKNSYEAFEYLLYCDNRQVLEMLYDYDTRLFIQEASSAYDATYGSNALCSYFEPTFYAAGPYAIPLNCEGYLQVMVPKHKLIERLLAALPNFGSPGDLQQIIQQFSTIYNGRMNEVAFKYFNECDLKECANSRYDDMSNEDSTEIFKYLKEEKWTGILRQMRTCRPDSFHYYFAKTYPGFVAQIFENRHYPLIRFMDDIEDYFDEDMRNKLDGDTLTELQYYAVNEFHMYGSSRLGISESGDTTIKVSRYYNFSRSENELGENLWVENKKYDKFAVDSIANMKHGNKRYEGTNHLGNVLVVYSDKRLIGKCDADTVTYYKADLIAATDYSPFGAPIKQWYASGDSGCKYYTYSTWQTTKIVGSFDNNVIKGTNNTIIDGAYTWKPNDTMYTNLDTITVNGNRKLKVDAVVSNNERFALLDFEVPAGASCTLTFDMKRYTTTAYNVNFQYFYNSSGSTYTQIGTTTVYNTDGLQTFIFTANATTTKHRFRFYASAIATGRYFTLDDVKITYQDQYRSTSVASSFDNYTTKGTNNTIIDGTYTWKPNATSYVNLDTITVNGNRKLKVKAEVDLNERFALIDFEAPAGASCTLTFDMMRYVNSPSYNVRVQYFYNSSGSVYTVVDDVTYTSDGVKTLIITTNATTTKHRFRFFATAIASGRYFTLDDVVITYSDTGEAMNCDGSNGYKFGFNGKENDKEIGLQDYGARIYNPALGKFLSVDPFFRKFPMLSSYQFASNSPVLNIDLDGLEATSTNVWDNLFKYSGITTTTANQVVDNFNQTMEKAGRLSKDVTIITGGGIAIAGGIASGGTLPIIVGSVSAVGGGIKFYFDAKDKYAESDATPTTISGSVAVSVNYLVGDEVFSKSFIANVEFVEGVASLDLKNLKDPTFNLQNAGNTITILSIVVDNKDISENLKVLFTPTNANSSKPKENIVVSDNTQYVSQNTQALELLDKQKKQETPTAKKQAAPTTKKQESKKAATQN